MQIIGILLLLLMFGGMIGGTLFVLKKTDPKNVDTSLQEGISTSQEFLPYVDLKDSMISLGNHDYRAIVDVSSINYNLKSGLEKERIEIQYAQFLNSLSFDITVFISTRKINNETFLANLKQDYERTLQDFPNLVEYANRNFQDMEQINDYLNITLQKKKYIIIPYNEANNLSMQTDEEKYQHSKNEMATRIRIIQEGLSSIGLTATLLHTPDLIDLLVQTYHRNEKSHAEQIYSKEYTNMIVEGKEIAKENELFPREKLDLLFSQMEERIHADIIYNPAVSEEEKAEARRLYEVIRNTRRDKSAGGMKVDIQEEYYEELEKNFMGVKKDEKNAKKQTEPNTANDSDYDEF